VLDLIIDFLFPNKCTGCGVYGEDLCKKCQEELPFVEQICPECGNESSMGWTHPKCRKKNGMEGLIVIFDYQDETVRAVIDEIKFDFNKELIRTVLKNFKFETGFVFDYLVPVPLHYYRENWRGFNQAEEIAKAIEMALKVPTRKILIRKRKTKQQSLLSNRKEREENIKGAFEVLTGEKPIIRGKKVLLVDDVFTSGADMRECTKVLKKAGVETVWGIALAH